MTTVKVSLLKKRGNLSALEKFLSHFYPGWELCRLNERLRTATIERTFYEGVNKPILYRANIKLENGRITVEYISGCNVTNTFIVKDDKFYQVPENRSLKVVEFFTGKEYTMTINHYDFANPNVAYGFIQVSYRGRSHRIKGYANEHKVFYAIDGVEIMKGKSRARVN